MNNKIFIFFIFLSFSISAQHYAGTVNFSYRFGLLTNQIKQKTLPAYQYPQFTSKPHTQFDQGIVFDYQYEFWRKYHFYATTGVEFGQTKRYFDIIEPKFSTSVGLVDISQNKWVYRFGIGKRFLVYDGKININLALNFMKRMYVNDEQKYILPLESGNSGQTHTYNITTQFNKFQTNPDYLVEGDLFFKINAELILGVEFKVVNNLFLTLNFSYSRNHYYFYDYSMLFFYYDYNGDMSDFMTDNNAFDGMRGGRDHFFYSQLGLRYDLKFDKRNELPTK